MKIHYVALVVLPLLVTACTPEERESVKNTETTQKNYKQWYTFEQTTRGYELYAANCAACHGKQGEGAVNWQQVGSDGKYPPPPLNGTGHTWHHPMRALMYTIKKGSPGGKGNMPPWEGKLTNEQIIDIMAWFQSAWPKDIYQAWARNDAKTRKKKQS